VKKALQVLSLMFHSLPYSQKRKRKRKKGALAKINKT